MTTACYRKNDLRAWRERKTSPKRALWLALSAVLLTWPPAVLPASSPIPTTGTKSPERPASAPAPMVLASEAVRLEFHLSADGIDWTNLHDLAAKREMLAGGEPFWSLVVEEKGRKHQLDNRGGWKQVSALSGPSALSLLWRGPKPLESGSFEVRCDVAVRGARTVWSLTVDNGSSATIRNVVFPRVVTRPLGDDGRDDAVVFPRGPGERHIDPFSKPLRYDSPYPGGWATYQFMTHYDGAGGLYVAAHDPVASTKDIEARTLDDKKRLLLAYDWPAGDATVAGNDFRLSGVAIIEIFRGDWFDAAQIYRRWAGERAQWWPRDESRRDTPDWMRNTTVWAMTGGTTESVVGKVRDFARSMGVPTALHWYNWHVIPFDDNYPHYFPAKPGFREGVAELHRAGVRVMPYINGRLWDTDLDDFASVARPAATKDERGEPYTEEYGSKQKLAAMCPTTRLWQDKVNEIVLRLLGPECGVDGVYIDQVAAASPRLCYDRSHGHPLGGGHWWTTQGYWPMLERLRAEMKKRYPQAMITTECNAEPYIHLFDAYLTWHWQHQGQVPVFPAIYGGRILMFGRAYRGGPTKDLALRMKAAQSLVFGEQIGWIGPDVIQEKENAAFLAKVAQMRFLLHRYLAEGEMARPPRIEGDIPDVTADWQWSGKWPVTDRAVQAGAWRAADGRVALIFVNVTTGTLTFDLLFNGRDYGFDAKKLALATRTEKGLGKPLVVPNTFRHPVRLEPLGALAVEVGQEREGP